MSGELPDLPARLTDPDSPDVRERIFRDSQESLGEDEAGCVFGDEDEADDFVEEGPGASSFGQWRNVR